MGLSNSADLNGDGLLDVVVGAYSAGFTVLFGLSDGGMSEPVSYPADPNGLEGPILLADINHDGQPDLLYAGSQEIDILLNNAGNLEQLLLSIPTTGVATVALASGDLDRDGLPDVVDGEETGNGFVVNAFMGLSDGGFSAAIPILTLDSLSESPLPSTLLVGDLNQDGYPDVVAANLGGVELGVVIHQPDGGYESMIYTFDGPITAALLPRVQGAPDLAVGIDQTDSQSGTHGVVQILVNAGDGHFTVSGTHKVTNLAEQLAVADFNGDCIPDVVVGANGCPVAEGLSVLYGRKDGDLGDPQPLPTADQNLTGVLSVLGPVAAPRALGSNVTCSGPTEVAFVVYGDASRH